MNDLVSEAACSLIAGMRGERSCIQRFLIEAAGIMASGAAPLAVEPTVYLVKGVYAKQNMDEDIQKAALAIGIARYVDIVAQMGGITSITGTDRPTILDICGVYKIPEELVETRQRIVHKAIPNVEHLK